MQRKCKLHEINANFPKQRAPNFILCEFAAIQTSQHTYLLKEKTAAFSRRRKTEEVSYPLKTDQYEDQLKDILNSILREELSDSDSKVLREEL